MTDQVSHRAGTGYAGNDRAVLAGAESFARGWATAVIGSSYVPMTRAEVVEKKKEKSHKMIKPIVKKINRIKKKKAKKKKKR